jgi:hypothetical protein
MGNGRKIREQKVVSKKLAAGSRRTSRVRPA